MATDTRMAIPMAERMENTAGAAWLAAMLQAHDSAYPTGAYAHSYGLEGLVQAGVVRDRAGLAAFLEEQALPQLARCDLPMTARAWAAAGAEPEPDWESLLRLSLLCSAMRGTRETRAACEAIGRQRLAMATMLRGGHALEFSRRSESAGIVVPLPVATGAEGRWLGAPREAVLTAAYYGAVSGLVAAAVKLLRLGQNAVQALLAATLAKCNQTLDTALSLPDAALGSANPWWDIASSAHETATHRLFIS